MKRFYVRHDRSSMRVGTDAVVLGAWTPLGARALDIGTGCGIIALMLAQRLADSGIDQWSVEAIDIDPPSVRQAARNFALSPWSEHLKAFQTDLNDWQGQYDLIVSNPPFFSNGLVCPDPQRARARQATVALSAESLVSNVQRLLDPDGLFAVILPNREAEELTDRAAAHKLNTVQRCHVCTVPGRTAARQLLVFSPCQEGLCQTAPVESTLTLGAATAPRSQEYERLTEAFYL